VSIKHQHGWDRDIVEFSGLHPVRRQGNLSIQHPSGLISSVYESNHAAGYRAGSVSSSADI
jgi:hypothetical protein